MINNRAVIRSCNLREEPESAREIFSLVERAFEKEPHSDHREQFLVEKLYQSSTNDQHHHVKYNAPPTYLPELSLVAELEKEIIGFALLTTCFLVPPLVDDQQFNTDASSTITKPLVSLVLAPLAIKPEYQRMGVGSLLMKEAHKRATELGFTSITVVGHADYYPKFGYKLMKEFALQVPYSGIPDENCMVVELVEGYLKNNLVKDSVVEYAKEFSNY